jgi:hypothetical protein
MSLQEHLWKILLSFMVLSLCFPRSSQAITVNLAWDSSRNAKFYVLYWGRTPGDHSLGHSPDILATESSTYSYAVTLPDGRYYFIVKAFDHDGHASLPSREVCVLDSGNIDPGYNRGWAITDGDLVGFKVMYDSKDPTPTLGSSDAIPNIPNVEGAGRPLNLQPTGTVFTTPVKVFIPCPGHPDVGRLDVYQYDGVDWVLANDAEAPGTVQPDASEWMKEGSRVDHNSGVPSTIEIQVTRFSGVQAGVPAGSTASGSNGGCIIATIAFGSKAENYVQILRDFREKKLSRRWIGRKLIAVHDEISPFVADFLRHHPGARVVVKYSLMPLVGFAYLALRIPYLLSLGGTVCLALVGVLGCRRARKSWRGA